MTPTSQQAATEDKMTEQAKNVAVFLIAMAMFAAVIFVTGQ